MKRILGLILTAVFLSVLCIPCAAVGTERAYPGFSDVPEDSSSYTAIKYCYERGLMNGTSETAFNPQGKLSIAQLVVLAARLYDLQNGGDGKVPELPDLSQPYLRFYGEDGTLFASFSMTERPRAYNAIAENPYISVSDALDDPALPEACTLEIGYEGYNHVKTFTGTRESYASAGGAMHEGFVGTGYRFIDPDARCFTKLPSAESVEQLKTAWWFPSVFYLASEGKLGIEGELFYRTSGGNQYDGYDPLASFSSDSATRSLFAWLVDLAAGDLEPLNETASVPDVTEETQDAEAILRLYRAGVLTGIDAAGNFGGGRDLTRAQAAIMLNRVLDPAARVKAP